MATPSEPHLSRLHCGPRQRTELPQDCREIPVITNVANLAVRDCQDADASHGERLSRWWQTAEVAPMRTVHRPLEDTACSRQERSGHLEPEIRESGPRHGDELARLGGRSIDGPKRHVFIHRIVCQTRE